MDGLGAAAMILLASYGLKVEKTKESTEQLLIYISTPAHSYRKNEDGEELAGEMLAKRYKNMMIGMGVKRLTVKYRVREEYWTKELAENAEMEMRKSIFGSQY